MAMRLNVQTLEARDCPAFLMTFQANNLRITFDNDVTTTQSVQMSANREGLVTLNEIPTAVPAAAVRSITVVGSDRNNAIDLKFVSAQMGFRSLDDRVLIQGGRGDDVLLGTQFGDNIFGGDGNDQLNGDKGNDDLDGGKGTDWITHGEGADRIYVGPGDGVDWIDRLGTTDRIIRR